MLDLGDLATLVEAVRVAAPRAEVRDAVNAIYAEVTEAVNARRPRCDISGRCCRFEEFGHRLFITTIELATFLHEAERRDVDGSAWDGTGCPYQVGKLCGVHAIRPFGCQMFFCDPSATEWQSAAYERFHGKIKDLHAALGVSYFYVEWRAALAALGLSDRRRSVVEPHGFPSGRSLPIL